MMTTIRAVALAACLWMGLAAPQVFAQNAYSPDRPDANFMARDQAIRNKTDVKIPDYDPALKMNMAKSLIRQTGLPCDPGAVGDPYLAPGKVNGQAVHVWVIEVGCQDRRGFLLESREAGRASAYPIGCLEAAAIHDRQSDAPVCKLPSNAAPFAWLTDPARPFLPDCTITRARFVGENETSHRETYEIGCQAGKAGGVLVVPNYRASDTHVAYLNCLKVLHTRFECVLTQDAEAVAGVRVFHAGTARREGRLVTAGGRVLGVTAVGDDVPRAIEAAYEAVGRIRFEGMHFRRDIGRRRPVATYGHGGPEMAPIPPDVRSAPAEPERSSSSRHTPRRSS